MINWKGINEVEDQMMEEMKNLKSEELTRNR
jgi:hypothetical protein